MSQLTLSDLLTGNAYCESSPTKEQYNERRVEYIIDVMKDALATAIERAKADPEGDHDFFSVCADAIREHMENVTIHEAGELLIEVGVAGAIASHEFINFKDRDQIARDWLPVMTKDSCCLGSMLSDNASDTHDWLDMIQQVTDSIIQGWMDGESDEVPEQAMIYNRLREAILERDNNPGPLLARMLLFNMGLACGQAQQIILHGQKTRRQRRQQRLIALTAPKVPDFGFFSHERTETLTLLPDAVGPQPTNESEQAAMFDQSLGLKAGVSDLLMNLVRENIVRQTNAFGAALALGKQPTVPSYTDLYLNCRQQIAQEFPTLTYAEALLVMHLVGTGILNAQRAIGSIVHRETMRGLFGGDSPIFHGEL